MEQANDMPAHIKCCRYCCVGDVKDYYVGDLDGNDDDDDDNDGVVIFVCGAS